MLGEKNDWKGRDEKGGKIHIFLPIGKKYAYLFFTNWLKIYKNATKKGWIFL